MSMLLTVLKLHNSSSSSTTTKIDLHLDKGVSITLMEPALLTDIQMHTETTTYNASHRGLWDQEYFDLHAEYRFIYIGSSNAKGVCHTQDIFYDKKEQHLFIIPSLSYLLLDTDLSVYEIRGLYIGLSGAFYNNNYDIMIGARFPVTEQLNLKYGDSVVTTGLDIDTSILTIPGSLVTKSDIPLVKPSFDTVAGTPFSSFDLSRNDIAPVLGINLGRFANLFTGLPVDKHNTLVVSSLVPRGYRHYTLRALYRPKETMISSDMVVMLRL